MDHVGINIEINKQSNLGEAFLSGRSPTRHSPHSTYHVKTGGAMFAAIPLAVVRGPCVLVPCISVNIIRKFIS